VADRDIHHQSRRGERARRFMVLVAVGALVLVVRLFDLQVLGVDEYTLQSERNRIRREWVNAPRGLIVDRNGVVLADSRPSFTVLAVPGELLPRAHSLQLLAELLEAPAEEVRERLENVPSQVPRVVRRDVPFAQVSRIAEREEDLPGVSLEVTNVRSYPLGATAAHLLGHVGEISQSEVDELTASGYRSGQFLGRTGIERVYEQELRGVDGERYHEVDALGRVVGDFSGREPVAPEIGGTLQLSLDVRMQTVAESLLVGRRGAVCVLDAQTGGVVVLASAPRFDPNHFATGIGADEWNRLNTDPDRPLLNRTVQAIYAPGSTFKPVSFVVALEKHVIGFRDLCRTPCLGGYRFGNRWFGCWEEKGHGRLDLEMALVRSCDSYFYQIGERVSPDDLAEAAKGAGLGARTGIDLPQESPGNVPSSAWLDERYGPRNWTQGTVLNLVIGQGEYLVTPLQLARFAAAIGNGGRVIRPRIVREIESADGSITRFPPRVDGTWEMSPSTRSRLQEAMRLVVEHDHGTARSCRVEGVGPSGKTGTAENPHGRAHSWFMGYAPPENPELAFAVIVEGGGHGSDVAVPITRQLLVTWFGEEEAEETVPAPPVEEPPVEEQS
jgi:penicillin-binding protein 2